MDSIKLGMDLEHRFNNIEQKIEFLYNEINEIKKLLAESQAEEKSVR